MPSLRPCLWTAGRCHHRQNEPADRGTLPGITAARAAVRVDDQFAQHPAIWVKSYWLVPNASTSEPALMSSRDGQLLGQPRAEWSALGGTVGSGATICIAGDFNAGYVIADRLGLTAVPITRSSAGPQPVALPDRSVRHGCVGQDRCRCRERERAAQSPRRSPRVLAISSRPPLGCDRRTDASGAPRPLRRLVEA